MDRLSIRKDKDGKVVMDVLPGDPIATLDGRPFVPKKNVDENGVELVNLVNVIHRITNLPGEGEEVDEKAKRKKQRRRLQGVSM